MRVLDVGCGWGSLTLFVVCPYHSHPAFSERPKATAFPECQVTAVSNSATQKTYIEDTAAKNGLRNVRVITSDINTFEAPEIYDRILSIEMFEHMKNYKVSSLYSPKRHVAEQIPPGFAE